MKTLPKKNAKIWCKMGGNGKTIDARRRPEENATKRKGGNGIRGQDANQPTTDEPKAKEKQQRKNIVKGKTGNGTKIPISVAVRESKSN